MFFLGVWLNEEFKGSWSLYFGDFVYVLVVEL